MQHSFGGAAAAPATSILPGADGAPGLPVFASIEEALAAHLSDDPLFVLYPQRIAAAAELFLDGFAGRTMFAVKVNPHPAVLRTLWAAGVRDFDVASAREIALVQALLPGARMAFMHPVKPRGAIAAAWEAGVADFAFDSEGELAKIVSQTGGGKALGLHLRLALPKGDGAASLMDLSGKFGADFETAAALLRAARPMCGRLGLTFHVGSQCMEPGAFARAVEYAAQVAEAAGVSVDALDVGGGFPSRYPGMEPPAMDAYFAEIEAAARRWFPDADLAAEPGRALVADGGATCARIEMRRGADLFLNDGAYGSLYDAANFAWRYPTRLLPADGRAQAGETAHYRFFGPTCDSADRMEGPFALPADAAEGDWVEIGALGAYGQTMATRFNGYYSDCVVAVLDGARQAFA